MLQFSLSLLISLLLGFLTVSLFWRSRSFRDNFLVKICLSAAVGLGISSSVYFVGMLLFGNSRKELIIFEAVVLILLAFATLFLRKRKQIPIESPEFKQDGSNPNKFLAWSFLLTFIISVFNFVCTIAKYPFGNWDAWLIWNLHAKFFFTAGNNWKDYFDSGLNWTHPDYPLLIPAIITRCWNYIGHETILVPVIIGFIFTFCTGILLYLALTMLKSKNHAYLAGIVLFSTPFFIKTGTTLCADTPLSFFFLSTIILFALYRKFPNSNHGLLILAGIAAGLGAWCKNEGLLMILAIMLARLIIVLPSEGWKVYLKESLSFTAGMMPFILMIVYFKIFLAPANDLFIGQNLSTILSKVTDASRYGEILSSYMQLGWMFTKGIINPFTVVLFMAFAGLNIQQKDKVTVKSSVTALILVLFAYFALYLVTPHDLYWHLNSSLDRLFIQLWPSFLFTCFMML